MYIIYAGISSLKKTLKMKKMLKEAALVVFMLMVSSVWKAHAACEFPSFVHTNGTDIQRFWKGMIRNQNGDQSLDYTFLQEEIIIQSKVRGMPTIRQSCLYSLKDNKFLIKNLAGPDEVGSYKCIQIVKRAEGVIQLKSSSSQGRPDEELCEDDNLELDPWIIMDTVNIKDQQQQCPIYGGFNINVFDKRTYKTKCDANQGETRLECECEPGAGMHFQFRRTTCVPEGLYMYSSQITYCLADWQEEDWKFILIKHDQLDYMWIFRFPADYGDRFHAHIFRDLVVDSGRTLTVTQNYLRVDMMRDTSHLLNSLCRDDYEVCDVWKDPCALGNEIVLTCPKKCGVCNSTVPSVCSFREHLQGQWKDANHPHGVAVTINQTAMNVHGFETFHCINFPGGGSTTNEDSESRKSSEQLLVSVSSSGCKPRYTCARMKQSAPSVLFFQLSESKMWPLTDSPAEQISCKGFSYIKEHSSASVRYRSNHYKPLVSEHLDTYVECDMRPFSKFVATFKDDTQCLGNVIQPDTKDSIELAFEDCDIEDLPKLHNCLEHTRMQTDMLIVTKTVDEPTKVFCWIFPRRPRNTFYLVEAHHCNEVAMRRLRKSRFNPYAVFIKHKKTTVLTTLPNVPSNGTNVRNSTRGLNKVILVNTNITFHNVTEVTSEKTDNSPFVVAAVVVTFMILQIPCLCKK